MGTAAVGVAIHLSSPARLQKLSPGTQQPPDRRSALGAAPWHRAVQQVTVASLSLGGSCAAGQRSGSAHVTVYMGGAAAEVTLFGVRHAEEDDLVGEYILSHRPAAVVVETALTMGHGARTGTVMRLDAPGTAQELQRDLRARMICQLGLRLREAAEPIDDPIWRTARKQYGGEQLAYIAAIAVNAELVFGDVPKEVTFRQLLANPTLADLDEAYARQSWLNYRELLTGRPAAVDWTGHDHLGVVESLMLRERDVRLASSLVNAACAAAHGQRVVGVLGEAHLPGVHHLLDKPAVLEHLCERCKPAPAPRVLETSNSQDFGLRLGLLESVLRLSCREEVVEALHALVPRLSPDQQRDYEAVTELYGSTRMLLAVLGREQLAQVVSGLHCDFYDVLEPVRAVRPTSGGAGYEMDLINDLRLLHFQIDPSE